MTGAVLIADDLFAGAGGWDLAAEALGIHARGIENMPAARATREAAGLTTLHDDVWTYEPDGTADLLIASPPCQSFSAAGKGNGRKALDVVLSIVPLVPHLTLPQLRNAAKMFPDPKTGEPDERTALVLTPLWFAVHHPYRMLAWEQVPQVLPVWEACAEVLRPMGWNVVTGKLYSEQYGVAQTRTRAKLLASLDHDVELPPPTHSRYYSRSPEKLDADVLPWVSMATALTLPPGTLYTGVNGATLGPGPKRDALMAEGRWDECHKPQERDVEVPAPTVMQPGRWRMISNYGTGGDASNRGERTGDQPAPTVMFGARSNAVTWQFAGAGQTAVDTAGQKRREEGEPAHTITGKGTAAWCATPAIDGETAEDVAWTVGRPSPTVVGTFAPDVVAAPGYRKAGDPPRQKTPGSVRVTVAEAGVLQSFPVDYPWQGTKGQQYLQCGNAVPPLMALHALAATTGRSLTDLGAGERVEIGVVPNVVLRMTTMPRSAVRGLGQPAPTIAFGHDAASAQWIPVPPTEPEEQTA